VVAWVAGATGLVLWVAVPALGIGALRDRAEQVRYHRHRTTTVEAVRNRTDRVTDAGLRASWVTPAPVVAPSWDGIVTGVLVEPGTPVTEGLRPLSINGVDRVLVASRAPFSRPLGPDDRGADVADLNAYLRRAGLPADAGDRFGPATARGVAALGVSLGTAPAPMFDPGLVLYLAPGATTVESVAVGVGAPAPAVGAEVVTLSPRMVEATVIAAQDDADQPAPEGPPDGDPAASGPEAPPTTPPAVASAPAMPVPDGATARAGSVQLRLGSDRATVDPGQLDELRVELDPPQTYLAIEVVVPPGPRDLVVPAGAVISDQQGQTCVLTAGRRRAAAVLVVSGDQGRAVVVPADPEALRPGDRVAVAPPAARRSCS
jgi:hypothetical protein